MDLVKNKIYSSLSLLCFNLFIASLLLVVLSYFSILSLDVLFNSDIIFGIGLFLGFLSLVLWEKSKDKWHFSFKWNNKKESKEKVVVEIDNNLFFRVVPYLFLFMLLVIAVNQFFKWDFVNAQMMRITILAIAFGFLIFWNKRHQILINLEKDRVSAENLEKRKYLNFPFIFPKIQRIFGLNIFLRRIYAEGANYIMIILGVIITSLSLTIYFWHYIKSFWIDEYVSILSATTYLNGSFPYLPSGNALGENYIYNFLLSKFIMLFNYWIHAGRVMNLLCLVLSLPLLYFIVKKIFCKNVGILAILIFSASNFTLLMANEIRAYQFSIFIICLIIFILIYVKNNYILICLITLLSLILLDNQVTNLYLLGVIFFIYLIYKSFYKNEINKITIFYLILAFFILAIISYKGNPLAAIKFYFGTFLGTKRLFWAQTYEPWFYPYKFIWENTIPPWLIILSLTIFFSYLFLVKNKKELFKYLGLIVFIVILIFPQNLNRIPNSYRYFYNILPFFCVLFALGIYPLWMSLRNKNKLRWIFAILFLILLISNSVLTGQASYQDIVWSKTMNFELGADLIKNYSDNNTILVTNYMALQIEWYDLNQSYMIVDKQTGFINENAARYGTRNLFGHVYSAPPGNNPYLNISYITPDELMGLFNLNKTIIVFIRPWPTDISLETLTKIEKSGANRIDEASPFYLYVRKY